MFLSELRVKKASNTKPKTGNRAKQARGRSSARRTRAQPTAAAKARAPRSRANTARTSRSSRRKNSAFALLATAYSSEECKTLLLVLVPFVVITAAIGASQLMRPDPLSWRIAHMPISEGTVEATRTTGLPEFTAVAQSAAYLLHPISASNSIKETRVRPARLQAIPADFAALIRPVKAEKALPPVPPEQTLVAQTTTFARLAQCEAPGNFGQQYQHHTAAGTDPEKFGKLLAAAAEAQTRKLVIYTDKYRHIGFPMGDVPDMYGACTDVVVRAYRALGIDLQELVHKARLGTGDPSIDHRRTKTLRRFFEKHGNSIPVTDFPEDYHPGDIVTYYRAEGRGSQSHIAIVSDAIAPSGRPMIVHNRGWGPQVEDALFAHQVTGHYRYAGVDAAAETPGSQAMLNPGAPKPH